MNEEQNSAEREYIEKEAAQINWSEKYFDARPQFDTLDRHKVFESGFDRGWQAALSARRVRELERTLELFRAATSQELHERIAEIVKKKIK